MLRPPTRYTCARCTAPVVIRAAEAPVRTCTCPAGTPVHAHLSAVASGLGGAARPARA